MKEVQFTLYEVFGYFIPGIVSLAGLLLLATAWVEPRLTWIVTSGGSRTGVALALGAYLMGHAAQATANVVFSRSKTQGKALEGIPDTFRKALLEHLSRRLGQPVPEASLAQVCDAIVGQEGKTEMRDVFTYREGFYRGLLIGFAVLVVGIVSTWITWQWPIPRPTHGSFAVGATLSAVIGGLALSRHGRFVKYRIEDTVFGTAAVLGLGVNKD